MNNSIGGQYNTEIPVWEKLCDNGFTVYIDGYIMPRCAYYQDLKHLNQVELAEYLYKKHGRDFVKFIKGVFCVVILHKDKFLVFTDRHSINNFFVYQKANSFIVSNSMDLISARVELEVDKENAATFTLLSHFINGATMFENVKSSTPGMYIEYDGTLLTASNYWQVSDLLKKDREISLHPYNNYADQWNDLIGNYLEYLKPSGVSITITAGNDSRMVLASLLAHGTKVHGFTYGNPESYEAVISKKVAEAGGFAHSQYFAEHPDASWMEKTAANLVELGNSMVSIQRAHRYDAYDAEHKYYPDNNMIFTGLMGGEYIKKPGINSPALHPLIHEIGKYKSKSELFHFITKKLVALSIRTDVVDVKKVCDQLLDFMNLAKGYSDSERSFIFLYLYYGCAHHSQDSRILSHFYDYPVSPFMDIDFLQMLAGYKQWYVNSTQSAYNRLFHSEFLVAITHILAPQLSQVPYGKRGKYTAADMMSKRIKYVIDRIRYIFINDRKKYPRSFVIGKWMYDFCKKRLACFDTGPGDIFVRDMLSEKLELLRGITIEADWQSITNPVNLLMNEERFEKKKSSHS
ncbi:MAG: hypothetical protein Q8M98_11670 [Candidatus Cloacimonadaceae bacterium]|nr:hypothetical protein [Candidatus Cloacimonadaceae bacterium]